MKVHQGCLKAYQVLLFDGATCTLMRLLCLLVVVHCHNMFEVAMVNEIMCYCPRFENDLARLYLRRVGCLL